MKTTVWIHSVLSSLCVLFSPSIGTAGELYPGEEIRRVDGYPALVKFVKGDPTRPTVVFIPGAFHLGRVSYGAPRSDEKDFLAYWVHRRGYSFAAISYPLDNPVYEKVHPEFSIRNWGRQSAEITSELMAENGLSRHVILLGWSNAGKIPPSYNVAAKRLGVTVEFFVSLSATSPLPGQIPGLFESIKPAENGLAAIGRTRRGFIASIREQNELNGHEIIPEDVYSREFIGDFPVGLLGPDVRFRKGEWERDQAEGFEDSGVFRYAEYPLVTLILGDSATDARHVLTDLGAWSFFISQKIFLDYVVGNSVNLSTLSPPNREKLIRVTREAPDRLATEVHGNHFCFVGQKGAREVSDRIEELEKRARALKAEIGSLLGVALK